MRLRSLWSATLLVASLGTLLSLSNVFADPLPRRTLAAERSWVKFGIVLGRLQVLNSQVGQTMSAHQEDPTSGIRESFSINAGSEQAVVHYELAAPDLRLTVHFSGPDSVRIEKTPLPEGEGEVVRLVQPARGSLELVVGEGSPAQRYRAASFWHLMLEHRDACQTHLVPILESLRIGWQLEETADDVQATLLKLADQRKLPQTDRWALLVRQLSRGTFAQRQAAERELRQAGQAVVAYLRQLNPRRLDTEQRERIRSIIDHLVSRSDDTPERVALWLNGDRDVWETLALQGDPTAQRLAAAQLERLRVQTLRTATGTSAGLRR